MKLWTLQYHLDDTPSGSCAEYFASKRNALIRVAELRHEYPLDEEGNPPDGTAFFIFAGYPMQIDVPTTRFELVLWLNANAYAR
jgi:hypothetical protein